MAEQNEDAKQIIDGILEDARGEAEKIRREAESRVEDRRMLLSGRVQRIKDDAVGEAKRRAEEIRRRTDAEISRAQRRNDLARRRDVIAAVEGEVHRRFEALSRGEAAGGVPGARNYTQVLTGWIVEGAIGLEGTRFTVSAGAGETSTVESLIADAERKATELSGREIHLDVAEQPHGETPGVIISSPDGRTIYDNRINARMRRHQSEIRGIIYETLFSEDSTAGGASAGSEAGGDGDHEDRGDDAHGADV